MSKPLLPPLAPLLQSFFWERLQDQRQASRHTLASYRDTLRLLLAWVARQTKRPPHCQTLQDWKAPVILQFLDHLESQRGWGARTRNARLAAGRAFWRYASQQDPALQALASQVLAIPMKRYERVLVQPLSTSEVSALLLATADAQAGRRDHLLFNLLYHTGARISEALGLRWQDVQWEPPASLRLHGKGRKERTVPLLAPLAAELRAYWKRTHPQPSACIFLNRFDRPLSRSGAFKRLQCALHRAAAHCPSLQHRQVSPHTFRHTTALRLMEGGVDLLMIALLLGHESPATTHHYLELDLEMKEACLRKIQSPAQALRFKPEDSLLKLLQAL
jgi:integrase/recombinase XerD